MSSQRFARHGQLVCCLPAKPNVPDSVGASCRLDGREEERVRRGTLGKRRIGSVVDVHGYWISTANLRVAPGSWELSQDA